MQKNDRAAPRRIFAGAQARGLRQRLGLSLSTMAARVGISVSYLSQIEADDRPMTDQVLLAFARTFPADWADISAEQRVSLLAQTIIAAQDPTVAGPTVPEDVLGKAIRRQPALAERLIAIHNAYQRSQDQLRALDDAFERGREDAALPWEQVRDWFHARDNYIDTLDRGAEHIAGQLADAPSPSAQLQARLAEIHGVAITARPSTESSPLLRRYDPTTLTLTLDSGLPSASQAFLLAHQLVRLELAEAIATEVDAAQLRTGEARALLSVGLANYAAGALLMPYAAFRAEARRVRHDIDALRHAFSVSFEQACHRLSTLQRPGAAGTPLFFCRIDMAGNITKRHSATRLQFARYGGTCPLWIAHEAAASPERILTQLAETPDGVRYISMARGIVKPSSSYARLTRRYAVALGCEVSHAPVFVYGDQIDLDGAAATPIGVSCRICPRDNCEQRAFPPVGRTIRVDPDERDVVPYRFH